MPGNQVEDEIPGAPVFGTSAPELCSELGRIFPRLAEMEKHIGCNPMMGSDPHFSFFPKHFWGQNESVL